MLQRSAVRLLKLPFLSPSTQHGKENTHSEAHLADSLGSQYLQVKQIRTKYVDMDAGGLPASVEFPKFLCEAREP